MPIANGIATDASPSICSGGCMNMPKCTSSGLIPCPSAGTISVRASGLARKSITPSRNAVTSAMIAVAYGAVYGRRRRMPNAATTAASEKATARYSIEPALPA